MLVGAFVLGVLAVRYRPPAPLVAFLIAIVAMFIVASLFRSMSGTNQAAGSRYVTLSVYLATFGLAAAGPKITIGRVRALAVGVFAAACNLVTFGSRASPFSLTRPHSGSSGRSWSTRFDVVVLVRNSTSVPPEGQNAPDRVPIAQAGEVC